MGKTRKPAPSSGDFFSIPLEGKWTAYGRVLTDKFVKEYGTLIWVYDKVSQDPVPVEVLRSTKTILGPLFVDDEGWTKQDWRILAREPLRPEEWSGATFRVGSPALGWSLVLLSPEGLEKRVPATADQVREIRQLGISTDTSLAIKLREIFKPSMRSS